MGTEQGPRLESPEGTRAYAVRPRARPKLTGKWPWNREEEERPVKQGDDHEVAAHRYSGGLGEQEGSRVVMAVSISLRRWGCRRAGASMCWPGEWPMGASDGYCL